MDLSTLETDPELVNDGVVVLWESDDDEDGVPPAKILIRGAGYKPYEDAGYNWHGKLADRKTKQKINAKNIRKNLDADRQALARHIWISHEDLTYRGAPLPNTLEAKVKALQHWDFYQFIQTESQRIENFQKEAAAEDAEAIKSVDGVAPQV